MSLLNPFFLLGILAAGVPVLLHLARRADARKIEYPSLMYLRRISRRYIRFQKLRHLLLLLMRVLVLLLIALAFARPYRKMLSAAAGQGQPSTAHIILLDNSMSMAYGERWSRAKVEAARVAKGARSGDLLALLEFSDQTVIRVHPTSDFVSVLNRIEAAAVTDRATRYEQALRMAERVALDAAASRRMIHLISDFQKSGLVAGEQGFRLRDGIELKGVDVGETGFSNLALTNCAVQGLEGNPGGPFRVFCSIVNSGDTDRAGTRITASVDGRVSAERKIGLAGGSVERVEFTIPAQGAGSHTLVLQVEDANLVRDNRFSLRLDVYGRRPVVSVEEPKRTGRSPGIFLDAALNVASVSPFALRRISPHQFLSTSIDPATLVIWNDATSAGSGLGAKMEELVKSGGGLAIVISDSSWGPLFNRLFGPWLPLRIETGTGRDVANSRPAEDFRLLSDLRMDHPVFRPFSGPHSGNFTGVRFFRHARVSVDAGADVLARFDNGDPALVAAEVGRGRVALFTSSADDSGNDLPFKAVYAPLWQQLLRYLEKFREDKPWYRVGDAVDPGKILSDVARGAGRTDFDVERKTVVLDPGRRRVPPDEGSRMVTLDQAGFYDVRSANLDAAVAVNTSPIESDLTHADADALVAGWGALRPAAMRDVAPEEPLTPEGQEQHQGVWRALLLAALALFLGEGLLSNRLLLKQE